MTTPDRTALLTDESDNGTVHAFEGDLAHFDPYRLLLTTSSLEPQVLPATHADAETGHLHFARSPLRGPCPRTTRTVEHVQTQMEYGAADSLPSFTLERRTATACLPAATNLSPLSILQPVHTFLVPAFTTNATTLASPPS